MPGCSARLNVNIDRKKAYCEYCGAILPIEEERQKLELEFDGEKAGYDFEKGRQRAKEERKREEKRKAKEARKAEEEALKSYLDKKLESGAGKVSEMAAKGILRLFGAKK